MDYTEKRSVSLTGGISAERIPSEFTLPPPIEPPSEPPLVAVIAGFDNSGTSVAYLTWDGNNLVLNKGISSFLAGVGYAIAYNGLKFVACCSDGTNSNYLISSDGKNWDLGFSDTTNTEFRPNDIIWCDSLGLFVAGGAPYLGDGSSHLIATSPDGETWTYRSCPWQSNPGAIYGFAYSHFENKILAFGSSEAASGIFYVAMQSTDGINWSNLDTSPHVGNYLSKGDWNPDFGWVAVGAAGDQTSIMTNPGDENNPSSWYQRVSGGIFYDVESSGGSSIVAIGPSSIVPIKRSNNYGMSWSNASVPPFVGVGGTGVAYSSLFGGYISTSLSSNHIWTSHDWGDTWVDRGNSDQDFYSGRLIGIQ